MKRAILFEALRDGEVLAFFPKLLDAILFYDREADKKASVERVEYFFEAGEQVASNRRILIRQ